MIRGLVAGTTYPLRALRLLMRSPRLLQFFAIPVLVNIVVGIALYAGLLLPAWSGLDWAAMELNQQVDVWTANLPAWLGVIDWILVGLAGVVKAVLTVALLLLTGFLLLQFGTLIGAPWYGRLSEEIERSRLGSATVIDVGIVRDIGRALLFEVKKLALWGSCAIALLLLSWIPGLGGVVITVGWFSLTALITCLDFLDGPSERRRFRFRHKLRLVLRTFPASGSFSLLCCLLISVPLVNLLTIPLCVASGTLFWCDRIAPSLPPSPSDAPNE